MNYHIDSRSYLRRARLRLDEGASESLFYAAFELRCGIESRMQEYLDAQTHISEKRKKGWKIARLGNNIERAFKLGDRIAQVIMVDPETNQPLQMLYYTPVTLALRKRGQQLGSYLHAMTKHIDDDEAWRKKARSFLELVYKELECATKGTLLGPPLLDPEGQIVLSQECDSDPSDWSSWSPRMAEAGKKVILKIRYLDRLPG